MKIFLSSRERTAGIFIVVTALLVAGYFVGAGVRNRWLTPKVVFHTKVDRGDGLRSGSPILLAGFEIGEVGDLHIRDDEDIDVDLIILAEHANRVHVGSQAVVKRLLGIGEKRIQLLTPPGQTAVLKPGSSLPSHEPVDIMEIVSDLDLTVLVKTSGRALRVVEKLLNTLEEKDRFERMVASLDKIGPTLERVDRLIDDLHQPIVSIVQDPALLGAVHGADALLNDPATRRTLHNAGLALEPRRLDHLLGRADTLLARLDALTGDQGHLPSLLAHADKLLSDNRIDRLITSLDHLADEQKLARLLENVSLLAEQTGKISPEIPHLAKELTLTLREAVVVLKALQKTWMLEGKSNDARKELQIEQKDK